MKETVGTLIVSFRSPYQGRQMIGEPMESREKRPGPESTLDDVRARIVAAATARLFAEGVEIGLDHIKLSEAIEEAGATRATAYRSLAHATMSPQDLLRFQVLSGVLLRDSRAANHAAVNDAITAVIVDRADDLASDEIARRTGVLRELIRAGAEASHALIVQSRERSILVAAYGAITSRSPHSRLWVDELRLGEASLLEIFTSIYEAMAELFQLRLRDGYRMEHLTTAIASVAEGLAMRHLVNDYLLDIPLAKVDRPGEELWSLQGVTIRAIVASFFEVKDATSPVVDLSRL